MPNNPRTEFPKALRQFASAPICPQAIFKSPQAFLKCSEALTICPQGKYTNLPGASLMYYTYRDTSKISLLCPLHCTYACFRQFASARYAPGYFQKPSAFFKCPEAVTICPQGKYTKLARSLPDPPWPRINLIVREPNALNLHSNMKQVKIMNK